MVQSRSHAKGRLVETMHLTEFGMKVEIRLSTDLEFRARVGEDTLYDYNAEKLRKRIRLEVAKYFKAEWKPLVSITFDGQVNTTQKGQIEFTYERIYYAKIGDHYEYIGWGLYESLLEGGAPHSEFVRNARQLHQGPKDEVRTYMVRTQCQRNGEDVDEGVENLEGTVYRPYSDELWEGLEQLLIAVNRVNTKISDLIGTDEGLALITGGGQLALKE